MKYLNFSSFLLALLFFTCKQKNDLIIGTWRMHHMTHVMGNTELDTKQNEHLGSGEVVAFYEFRSDSSCQYLRNKNAPSEPVINGKFILKQDTLFIDDVFGKYTRQVMKLTQDSLVLLTNDHITTWYREKK